jgi:hypothetical protein
MSTNAPIKKPTPPTPEEIRSRKQDRLAGAVSPQETGSGGRREYFASKPSDFPLQPCDLKKWLKHDSLPIERACFVLLSFEPPPLHVLLSVQDKYNLSRERTWDRPPRYNDVFASLCVSIERGNISIHKIREGQYETKQVSWPDLVRWARSKDYPIAPELETLIADIEPVQTSAIATGTAPAQDTATTATVPETKEHRQDRFLKLCEDEGLPMPNSYPNSYLRRLPTGVGRLAEGLGMTRQTFSNDLRAALKRREAANKEGVIRHKA